MFDKKLLAEVREITGAGIVDCKNALIESENNREKAIEILRKKGMASSAKKVSRETKEGFVFFKQNEDNIYLCKIECETDFVSNSEKFSTFGEKVADLIAKKDSSSVEEFFLQKMPNGETVEEFFNAEKAPFGENIVLSLLKKIPLKDAEFSSIYLHNKANYSSVAGKIISIVVAKGSKTQENEELLKQIAMHVAASRPDYLKSEDIPEDVRQREMDIYSEKIKQSGKTGDIVTKIAAGMLEKFKEECVLLNQYFVMDNKKKVNEVIGKSFEITSFFLIK